MKMLFGDFNVYWHHDTPTPYAVRAACYGSRNNSGGLVPEVGDVINGFYGLDGEPIAVRVIEVEQFGDGVVAFNVKVTTIDAPAAAVPHMEHTTVWRTFNPPGLCCFSACGGKGATVMVVEWPEGRIEGLPEGVRGRTYACARDSGRIIAEQMHAGTTVATRFVDEGNW